MSTSGTSAIYIKIPVGSTIGFKERKDYISIFELNVVITGVEGRENNNLNNFDDNKNLKKIKGFKPNKYYGEREKLKF